MRKKNAKKETAQSRLPDTYKSATLPTCGYSLENFETTGYSLNDEEHLRAAYRNLEESQKGIINICDKYSNGDETDPTIEAQMEHERSLFLSEIARNNKQVSKIRAAIETRREYLDSSIAELDDHIAESEEKIEPLKNLRAQFQIHLGKVTISAGLIITIIAMIVDAIMNYGFLQTIYLDNRFSLMVAAGCLCLMSDGSMFGLGLLLSRRKETFMPKPVYYLSAVLLAGAFLLSIAGSVMIRFGSMPETFGTITASGDYVSKTSYTMAEYGATMVTAFATTVTGLLSGVFSYDENAYLVTIREKEEKNLAQYRVAIRCLIEERSLLEKCDDPRIKDQANRIAAEEQLKALRAGLKIYSRKLISLSIEDPDFLEKMAEAGNQIVSGTTQDNKITPIHLGNVGNEC